MSAWPETLPALPLQDGYSETLPDVVLRTQTETGPAKTRRRYTAGISPISMTMQLTQTEVGYLDSFFMTTLSCGALSFTWTNPRTGNSGIFRFKSPPAYSSPEGLHISVSLSFEELP